MDYRRRIGVVACGKGDLGPILGGRGGFSEPP